MKARPWVLALAGLLTSTSQAAVDYWAWHPSVKLSRVLADADRLYLLQGEMLTRGGEPRFFRRGFPPPVASNHPIVLVYRFEVMDWPDRLRRQIERDAEAFQAHGNRVWGIQLDFDAATRHLDRYGDFLRQVRADLPTRLSISVTGLMDWVSQGKPADLEAMGGAVDEVVYQAYQGRRPIKDHQRYFEKLSELPTAVPFKLGLVEGGAYDARLLAAVRRHPAYRGTVIFLLPEH